MQRFILASALQQFLFDNHSIKTSLNKHSNKIVYMLVPYVSHLSLVTSRLRLEATHAAIHII